MDISDRIDLAEHDARNEGINPKYIYLGFQEHAQFEDFIESSRLKMVPDLSGNRKDLFRGMEVLRVHATSHLRVS